MRKYRSGFFTSFIALLFITGFAFSEGFSQSPEEPAALHLTWQQDPTSTMTIDWHTEPGDEADHTLRYKLVGTSDWNTVSASQYDFPVSDRTIHRVELTGLDPNSEYRFTVGEFSRQYKFRTLPTTLERPVRFAAGGDTGRGENMERMNRVAAGYDIDFVAWGGDLSYADGRSDRVDRWYSWFDRNKNGLITEDGRVIPILTALGNHEMKRPRGGNYWYLFNDYEPTDEWREANAQYFFNLFAYPGQPGYGVLDFGDYLSFFLLDSDHANPVNGVQSRWLERELRERARRDVPHIIPIYHIPAYPSHRSYGSRSITNVRETWVPLFEQYGVRVALENHDHTYSRTHPIRNDEISDDGIVFIGDGAWGVGTREGNSSDEWYIDRFESVNHAIIVTLDGDRQEYIMVDIDGNEFDSYTDDRFPIIGGR